MKSIYNIFNESVNKKSSRRHILNGKIFQRAATAAGNSLNLYGYKKPQMVVRCVLIGLVMCMSMSCATEKEMSPSDKQWADYCITCKVNSQRPTQDQIDYFEDVYLETDRAMEIAEGMREVGK